MLILWPSATPPVLLQSGGCWCGAGDVSWANKDDLWPESDIDSLTDGDLEGQQQYVMSTATKVTPYYYKKISPHSIHDTLQRKLNFCTSTSPTQPLNVEL